MWDVIFKKALSRVSPFTILITLIVIVVWQDFKLLSPLIPEHSKYLLTFIFSCMGAMYESVIISMKLSSGKIDCLAKQMKIQSLKGAVNSMYARFEASGDEFIENEYTVKELAELTDLREELQVNSYTQDRLRFLNSRVKR